MPALPVPEFEQTYQKGGGSNARAFLEVAALRARSVEEGDNTPLQRIADLTDRAAARLFDVGNE